MTIQYDQENDTLTIKLGPEPHEAYLLEAGDYAVLLGDNDNVISITISNASRFIGRSLAAGVQVKGGPAVAPPAGKLVWHDADSSMISAYAYNQAEGVLEVAFHSTGVYRYFDVPLHIFEELHQASSKGRYMRGCIIDMYPYDKKRGR